MMRERGIPETVQESVLKTMSRSNGTAVPVAGDAPAGDPLASIVLELPWQRHASEPIDFDVARKRLDESHFGLKNVKERVLEYLAVRQLTPDLPQSTVLCFLGPSGMGKSTIARSIAEATGREFQRISLAGVRHESTIRGFHPAQSGATPGIIIQTLRRCVTSNPVILLDDIDKIEVSAELGDPATALLEVLDSEQNENYHDNYLPFDYNLSDVFFIATANDLYEMPEALTDRLEVVEFEGYSEGEKMAIANQYLIPRQLQKNGLSDEDIRLQKQALLMLIRQYTFEAGVRQLNREIEKIMRKIALRRVLQQSIPLRITPASVEKISGPPLLINQRVNDTDSIGVATGLVWSAAGGDIQTIEGVLLPGKGNITMTGQLGDVLQESTQTALAYLRSQADSWQIPDDDFDNTDIHIHMPEGSVPKEGPSAGITMAAVLFSIFTEAPLRSSYAMTGEITLHGKILPVGGIREKVLAAHRYQIPNLILPADNRKDMVDLPRSLLRRITIHYVEDIQQVLALILYEMPSERYRDLRNQTEEEPEAEG